MTFEIEAAKTELHQRLSDSHKIAHSLFVAQLMVELATELGEDRGLWEVVGICHDLDEEVTRDCRERHGMLTAEWLERQLPIDALDAIRAHDHRTGFISETKLADGLKLADTLAISDEIAGRDIMVRLNTTKGWQAFILATEDRPFLWQIIDERAKRLGFSLSQICRILERIPIQSY